MPRKSEAKTHTKVPGGTIYVKFTDPRDHERVNTTTRTTVKSVADTIANELTQLIHSPHLWNNVPTEFHSRTREIWRPIQKQVADASLALPNVTQGMLAMFPAKIIDLPPDSPEMKVYDAFQNAKDQIRQLLNTLAVVTSDNDGLKREVAALELQAGMRAGTAIALKSPLQVAKAVENFFASSTGTKSSGQWRDILTLWCNRFAREFPCTVQELTVEQVCRHIVKHAPTKPSTRDKLTTCLCALLNHATHDTFDTAAVKDACMLEDDTENEPWWWVNYDLAMKIIAKVKDHGGDYWADACILAYGCGLRPEEVPLIQSDLVVFENGKSPQIAIRPITDEKNRVIRRLKNKRAKANVQVPTFAVDALKRRVFEKEFLLFPKQGTYSRLKKQPTRWENEHRLWPPADQHTWSENFKRRIVQAGEKVEGFKDTNKLDGRVWRRSCARDLVVKYGYEHAASIIRDSSDVLRKHYADLQAHELSTER